MLIGVCSSIFASFVCFCCSAGSRAIAACAQRVVPDRRVVRGDGYVPGPGALSQCLAQSRLGHHVLHLLDVRSATRAAAGGCGGRFCALPRTPSLRRPALFQARPRLRGAHYFILYA